MTYLIVGAVALIVASAATLGFGWITANESLVWVSISATVGAAVLLALAYYRSIRVVKDPVASGVVPPPDETPAPEAEPVTGGYTGRSTEELAAADTPGRAEDETPDAASPAEGSPDTATSGEDAAGGETAASDAAAEPDGDADEGSEDKADGTSGTDDGDGRTA